MGRDVAGAVERSIRLLESLASHPDGLGLGELARMTGLGKPTIHRLLSSLRNGGMVTVAADPPVYSLGPKVLQLGLSVLRNLDVRQISLPWMRKLHQQIGETVALRLRVGQTLVCVDQIESAEEVRRTFRLGVEHPWSAGATGQVILAFLDEEDRASILRQSWAQEAAGTREIDPGAVPLRLEQVRQLGLGITVGELVPGAWAISGPVLDYRNQAVAAVTISGPISRLNRASTVAAAGALRAALNQISLENGCDPDFLRPYAIDRYQPGGELYADLQALVESVCTKARAELETLLGSKL